MTMVLYIFVNIILFLTISPEFSESMCTLKVTQPQEILYGKLNQSVSITCHISTSCRSKQVEWYVIKSDSDYQLDLTNQPIKYRLQGTDLHISWLSNSDNGIYYCTASDKHSTNSGAQDIGTGTKLTVKENNYSAVQVLLFTLLALLSLCNLIIMILFICIKTGRVTQLKEIQSQSQDKGESTTTVHFGAVLQELYSKRNLRRNKKNTSTEVAQKNKAKTPRTRRGKEDIYQNLNRA